MRLVVRQNEQHVSWWLGEQDHNYTTCFQRTNSPPQKVFVHWLKINFSELFVAWIHLKALRVFVESALRLANNSVKTSPTF